ncbi:MAG: hypothetical protein XD69_1449 [Clostridia bacterium 62_21]|nr:MAG: hypothetical protein XD69_1449 [Clostridia bacterium 62_21]HAG07272.1 hypothetical protein [Peptococcaceae bacterium]
MLDIIKEIVQDGFIDRWPTDGEDLLLLVRALGYFRQNALWAAVQVLEEVDNWHSATTRVLACYVPESTLLNAAAELYHKTFGGSNRRSCSVGRPAWLPARFPGGHPRPSVRERRGIRRSGGGGDGAGLRPERAAVY